MRWSSLLLVAFAPSLPAQWTLEQAVQQSTAAYPSIRLASEQAQGAAAAIRLARTAYLPKVDFHAQLNRATRNNIYGMLFPQGVIPPISGPPNPSNSMTSVWGSALGFLVSWEPFDFGQRQAQIYVAEASRRHADASGERARFDVSAAAADAFLTIVAAEETVKAAEAGVTRAKVFHDVVSALVKAELRPGAESARTRAELAMAETQRIQAEEAVAIAKASLAQYTGGKPEDIKIHSGRLLAEPPGLESASRASGAHPVLAEQSTVIDESKARQKLLDRSFFPKFNLQGTQYARGTGAHPDFTTGGAAAGLGPNIYNWGLGFSLTMPLMDYAALREKKAMEAAAQRTEIARRDLLQTELNSRIDKAKAMLDGARRIAANIPIQLDAARAAEQQATARYRAGLGGITEVAEAQRLLSQTEIDHALARLNVWRALLAIAAAQGELKPFLDQAGEK